MSNLTDYLENAVLNHILRNTAYTSPTTVYAGLLSVIPTDSASGTELSGNGYSRQTLTFAAPSVGSSATSTTLTWTASGANWTRATAIGIYDASTGGNLLFYKNISGKLVKDGESLTIDSGALTVTLD